VLPGVQIVTVTYREFAAYSPALTSAAGPLSTVTETLFDVVPPEGFGPLPELPLEGEEPPPQAASARAHAQVIAIGQNFAEACFMIGGPCSADVLRRSAGWQQRGQVRKTGETTRQFHDLHRKVTAGD
jgi:hypothetical protein